MAELREWIRQARSSAVRVVDEQLCALYWRIGTRIRLEILKDRRAEYGAKIVSAVGRQLEFEFGRGFSEKSLRHILREMEAFILELGVGFAFLERQKRVTVDGDDYYLDLLF